MWPTTIAVASTMSLSSIPAFSQEDGDTAPGHRPRARGDHASVPCGWPGAPQRPDDQHGLEEEPDQACSIGAEHRRRAPGAPLMDVAGEHRDEERGHQPADAGLVAGKRDEARAEHDLDRAGRDDDRILVEARGARRPIGHDDPVATATPRQVRYTGSEQQEREPIPAGGLRVHALRWSAHRPSLTSRGEAPVDVRARSLRRIGRASPPHAGRTAGGSARAAAGSSSGSRTRTGARSRG